MANILRRPTVWNRQPPGAYRIAAAWRSRVMSAWYPLAGVDVVRGNVLFLGTGGGYAPCTIVGDKLFTPTAGGNNPETYASLGNLASPGDNTRISTLTIATLTDPSPNVVLRRALFSIGNDGTSTSTTKGWGVGGSYTTASAWLAQSNSRYIGEQNSGTFVYNERAVWGTSYSRTNPTNTASLYKNGRLIGAGPLDAATDLVYSANPYCVSGRGPSGSLYLNAWSGTTELQVLFPVLLSAAEYAALSVNPWQLFEPIRRSIFAGGIAPIVGTGKAVGGGEAQAAGSGVKTGAGKAVGGGVARSSGSTVKAGTGAAVGGGVARSSGTAAKVGTGVAVGGGVARAAGSGSTSPTGTGKAVGGGTAAATGAATKAGAGRAVGGGVARASGFGIRSGTAIAVGGGVAKAAGGVVIPSVVDHYVKGWPVAASGAVIVHLVP